MWETNGFRKPFVAPEGAAVSLIHPRRNLLSNCRENIHVRHMSVHYPIPAGHILLLLPAQHNIECCLPAAQRVALKLLHLDDLQTCHPNLADVKEGSQMRI